MKQINDAKTFDELLDIKYGVLGVDKRNGFEVKDDWISLLSSLLLLVYGAYFGGRSLEKIQKIRN